MILGVILRVDLQNETEPQVIGKSCESFQCKLHIPQIRYEVFFLISSLVPGRRRRPSARLKGESGNRNCVKCLNICTKLV
jgi:hypothetical protein